jgi:EAL domain-containing protein (putative c-di-GMP-specific phosphodiesterase class I)
MSTIKTVPPPMSEGDTEAVAPRVLLADDDANVARALRRLLAAAGYDVTIAPDGAQAADALMQGHFDVILSDIRMPNMTGVELLSLVRAYDLDVPVILLTGDPSLQTAVEALKLGAMEYFTKPWDNDVLLAAVHRAYKLHALARLKREAMKLMGERGDVAGDLAGLGVAFDRTLESLVVAFQPIVAFKTRTVLGYECLLRSMDRALPTTASVLDAADKLERTKDLGRRVRQVIADVITDHPPPGDALVFMNIHPGDLLDPELFNREAPLSEHAARVVLEITERAALSGIPDVRQRIADLRSRGYRIALDDLGAGYAGLSSLAILEPDFVKLDLSLVQDLGASPVRQKLVGGMTATCRDLGMHVIAEGIERREDRFFLSELGCDLMQGFLFAVPGLPYPKPNWE